MRRALKEARVSKGFTVVELAAKIGVSPSVYYKWESGSRAPLLENARQVAIILGKTIEELFFVEEAKARNERNNLIRGTGIIKGPREERILCGSAVGSDASSSSSGQSGI